ncbi:hypothetical protein BVG16_12105 [Paenibacillus selenitireducens]|uniref:Uncharacterized protein n=1 Tax=Paenibacillus selenitireducens TaxID=1324314 RepID=A0A1T2XFE1_9BACL|nr:hypothetical protein BVG16_12105 [Paenibacillus selenitireducens]
MNVVIRNRLAFIALTFHVFDLDLYLVRLDEWAKGYGTIAHFVSIAKKIPKNTCISNKCLVYNKYEYTFDSMCG